MQCCSFCNTVFCNTVPKQGNKSTASLKTQDYAVARER